MRKIRIAQIGMNANSHAPHIFNSIAKQNEIFDFAGYALPENERERIPPLSPQESRWLVQSGGTVECRSPGSEPATPADASVTAQ